MPPLPTRLPCVDAAVALLARAARGDLADRAEQLGAELALRVLAQVVLLDATPGKTSARSEVVERRGSTSVLIVTLAYGASASPARRARGSCARMSRTRPSRRNGRRSRSARARRRCTGGASAAARRRRRSRRRSASWLALVGAQLRRTLEARRPGASPRRARARRYSSASSSSAAGSSVGLTCTTGAARVSHERAAVAVDDVAARRLDLDLAHAVLARLGDVLLAREHLQEPEAEEDDREQRERDAAEHRHAHARAAA